MIQSGKYMVGWRTYNTTEDGKQGVDRTHVAIYRDGTAVCLFPRSEAKEVARLMMSWMGLDAANELTDKELLSELKERGYKGGLRKEFEI